ncbi:MAG: di-heme-cytochrome C peroxidase [Gammaproteobacteria bacterium]|nr:di-heme-cytochrome C peroxidase [Gammaproteobacteria bacterium]
MSRIVAALLLAIALVPSAATETMLLDQGWNDHDRAWFYHVNQGSRLLSYGVFMALEAADGRGLFRDDANLRRYGYIPAPPTQYNPDGLPIGFARDRDYVGLTCAACHTSEFEYGGRRVRIEGGQAHIDLQSMLDDLERALAATLEDAQRFAHFQQRLIMNGTPGDAKALLEETLAARRDENMRNHTELRFGYARLDAFGAILNKGLALTGVDGNHNPPDAPTSYPYIWDTPHHDWVEWNGSSSNPLEGALARNVGEVIGVHGHVDVKRHKLFGLIDRGYSSSVRLRALRRIEKHVVRLLSPVWPETILPRIDRDLAGRGKPLFETYCGACHLPIDRTDPARKIKVRMSSLDRAGTDPAMARNAVERTGHTGRFEGKTRFYFVGETLAAKAPALYIVNHVMGGVMKHGLEQALLAQRDARLMGHGPARHPRKYLDGELMKAGTETTVEALLAYKARPLNGVWATAPYLHNGSVPNLEEMLLPAAQRSKKFLLGRWLFDPAKVGYTQQLSKGYFLYDTSLPGNSNAGHEYGTGKDGSPALDQGQRKALLEYLKTL